MPRGAKEGIDDELLALAMEKYKMEIAEKLGLKEKIKQHGWKSMSTAECGQIGGKMNTRLSQNILKKMINSAKCELDSGSQEDSTRAESERD